MSILSNISGYLADRLCEGSTRKLIAGWWYSILLVTFLLLMLSFWTVSTRTSPEAFTSVWSTVILIILSVGGTMVMRKFHNSFFTGFFIGGVVATSQYFFLLSLIYGGYAKDRQNVGMSGAEDTIQSIVSFSQAILLSSFALLLMAHRADVMDRNSSLYNSGGDQQDDFRESEDEASYDPPSLG